MMVKLGSLLGAWAATMVSHGVEQAVFALAVLVVICVMLYSSIKRLS